MRAGLIALALAAACEPRAPAPTAPLPRVDRPSLLRGSGPTFCAIVDEVPRCWGGHVGARAVAVEEARGAERFVGEPFCVVARDRLQCWRRPLLPSDAITVEAREPVGPFTEWIDECARGRAGPWSCPAARLPEELPTEFALGTPVRVTVGPGSVCALDPSGRVRCVGACASMVLPREGARDVALGAGSLCVLDAFGGVRCGAARAKSVLEPFELEDARSPVVRLMGGSALRAQCAVRADGNTTCWFVDGLPVSFEVPPGTVELAFGAGEGPGGGTWCARIPSDVLCRGDGRAGQLGPLAHGVDVTRPVRVAGLEGVRSFGLGRHRGCAVAAEGVRCWGRMGEDELRWSPVPWRGVEGAVEVRLGGENRCARTADGRVLCEGPVVAMRGGGPTARTPTLFGDFPVEPSAPIEIDELRGASQLAVGLVHLCAILPDATVRCVGASGFDGFPDHGLPADGLLGPVVPVDRAREVAVSQLTTCVRRESGEVVCWGGETGRTAAHAGFAEAMTLLGDLLCLGDRRRLRCVDLASGETVVDAATDARALVALRDRACSATERRCWSFADGSASDWAAVGDGETAPPRVAATSEHATCWPREGRLLCVGDASEGGLGDGVELVVDRWVPIALEP